MLRGIESLETRRVFCDGGTLLGSFTIDDVDDFDAVDTLPANQFYLRQEAHEGDALGQDGSDLLIVNNGDGSDFLEDGPVTTYTYDSLSRLAH